MMRPIFRTLSFWACVVMAWINLVILFLAKHLHNQSLANLAMLTMALCVVGAGTHWYLDRILREARERAQGKRRR